MSQARGLGRGFDALIPTDIIEAEFDPTAKVTSGGQKVSADTIEQLSPELIDPNPHQPRTNFNAEQLAGLADSIRHHGILQPVVVTKVGSRFELIAGERRVRAAKLVGLDSIPAIIRSFDDQQKLELALIENLQREELNPIETATAYRKLMDEFNMSLAEIEKRVGRDMSSISNTARLLKLPIEAKRALIDKKISEGHARQILALTDTTKQLSLLDMILKNGWNVRQAEQFVRGFKDNRTTTAKAVERIKQTSELTEDLSSFLGAKVVLTKMAKGKGRLTIEYYSEEELKRIYQMIKKTDI